jgi:hypothetical protein
MPRRLVAESLRNPVLQFSKFRDACRQDYLLSARNGPDMHRFLAPSFKKDDSGTTSSSRHSRYGPSPFLEGENSAGAFLHQPFTTKMTS